MKIMAQKKDIIGHFTDTELCEVSHVYFAAEESEAFSREVIARIAISNLLSELFPHVKSSVRPSSVLNMSYFLSLLKNT